MRFWRKSLLARLLVSFLLLALVSVTAVGIISYQLGRRALQEDVLNHLTTTATLKGDEIDRWVEAMAQDTRLLARDRVLLQQAQVLLAEDSPAPASSQAYQDIRAFLNGVLAEKPDWLEIMILRSTGGRVMASTNRDHEGAYEVTSRFFTEGRKSTYVQNVYPSVSLGKPAMTVATPLVDAAGTTFGVLAAHLNLARLDNIMLERGGLGATGETYLVDQYNVFISEARGGSESFPRGVHTTGIDAALLSKRDGAGLYDNYRAVPVLGAYRWLENRDMALLAEIELSEALAPVRGLARAVFLVGIGTSLLVAAAAYLLARQISRPVLELTETSGRMAAGELGLAVNVRREDELGTLGRAFNTMAAQMASLVAGLEQRVAERTAQLERRASQLATAADVGRAATSILEPEKLAQQAVDLLRERFNLYYAGLFLLDDAGEYAVLAAGTGEAGRTMRERGHKLEVGGTSMVGSACAGRRARIALDVGAEPVRFANPLLPETRSEMALPLVVGDRVLGAVDVQSSAPAAFSDDDIAVLQLVANQVAVAFDNAHKFLSEGAVLEATSPVFRSSRRLSAALTAGQVAWAIIESVAETEADGCVVARFGLDAAGRVQMITFVGHWDRHGAATWPLDQPFAALSSPLPLPLADRPWAVDDLARAPKALDPARQHLEALAARALLSVPLQTRGDTIGCILIYARRAGPFSPVSGRLYEAVAGQAAVAIERARLVEEAEARAARERAIRDVSEQVFSSFDLQTMLQTTLEQVGTLVGAEGGYVEMGS